MVTQKKYDTLKAMLIAQRRKNRTSIKQSSEMPANPQTADQLIKIVYEKYMQQRYGNHIGREYTSYDKREIRSKLKSALRKDIKRYGSIITTMPTDMIEQIIVYSGPFGSGRGGIKSNWRKWMEQHHIDENLLMPDAYEETEDAYLYNTLLQMDELSSFY